jgi:hypothetical protein
MMFRPALRRLCLLPILAIPSLGAAGWDALAQDCCDPNGPLTLGEDFPKTPATCETMGYWAQRAPDILG